MADQDQVIACICKVASHFGLAAPRSLFSGLALDGQGRLPFHQVEAALDLINLYSDVVTSRKIPTRVEQLPALLSMADGGCALLLEVKDSDGLFWRTGFAEPRWAPLDDWAAQYAGRAITVIPDPSLMRQDERPWDRFGRRHWFWNELYKVRQSFYPVLAAALLINLLAFALPLFTMNVYDRVIPNKAVSSLWVLASGVVLAFVLEFALRVARAGLLDSIGRDLDLKLSQKIFSKLVNIPLGSQSGSTGSMVARVSEYQNVRDFFASTTVVLLVDILFLFLFLALITFIAGLLVLIPLTMIGIMIMSGFWLQKRMTQASLDAQADSSLQQSLLVEAITGTETLKSCAAEGQMLGRWRTLAGMSSLTNERLRALGSVAVTLASLCQQMTSIGLVIGGFYLFDSGAMSMGAIIAIVMLAGRSLAPVGQLAFLMTRGRQAFNTLDSMQRMMEVPDERTFGSNTIIPTVRQGRLVLSNVDFAYPGTQVPALSGINLTIEPGEKVAIVGRVASGKSTLGRILCGLYPPGEGSMTVDGIDSLQYHPYELRSQLRYVGQDSALFSGTIKDNLLMGGARASEDELLAALRNVGADRFLARDSGGFDRATGERGGRLSGGQRSFLTLARAFVTPSRLLFLDEPTGAMDMQTEKLFIAELSKAIAPEQTLVVSTHRHPILAMVDRIIVMEGGRIVADGPRSQILASVQGAAAERDGQP